MNADIKLAQNESEVHNVNVNISVGFSLGMETYVGELRMAISFCLPTKPSDTLPTVNQTVFDTIPTDGIKNVFVEPSIAMQLSQRCNRSILLKGLDQMYLYMDGRMPMNNKGRIGLRSGNQTVLHSDPTISSTSSTKYPITTTTTSPITTSSSDHLKLNMFQLYFLGFIVHICGWLF